MSSSLESTSYRHGRVFGRATGMLGRLAVLTASAVLVALPGPSLGIESAVLAQSAAATPKDQDSAQAPRFKSAVDLVSVSAVVRDKKGRFVPHLSREDFIVVESGQRRQIVGFNAEADGPVKVAVLFDISGSM